MHYEKKVIDPGYLGGQNVIDFINYHGKENVPVALLDPNYTPISVDGFPFHETNKTYCRLPDNILDKIQVNTGVTVWGASQTTGGVLRFRTNSKLIGIRALIGYNSTQDKVPVAGRNGFTFYEGVGKNKVLQFTAQPSKPGELYFQELRGENEVGEEREWTIYMPMLTSVPYVRVILCKDAYIAPPTPFTIPDPILYYGSSISNGIAASNAGNLYSALIQRHFDANTINWGFNGSCKGEPDMAKIITCMPKLSLFVMGYDNNSPSPDNLRATHKPFYEIVRRDRPEMPILFVTRPTNSLNEDSRERAKIIYENYEAAKAAGDDKVWFLDMKDAIGDLTPECTVDGGHPNDRGFRRMADHLIPKIEEILRSEGYNC